MKSSVFLLIIGIVFLIAPFSQDVYTQPCPEGGLLIKTTLDISEFVQDYPTCKKINGTLTIGWPNKVVSSLSGLSQLEEIEGNLVIGRSYYNTTSFSNLSGLQNLNSIGGDLRIINNSSLSDISALENLESIGGSLEILANGNLSNCAAQSICSFIDNPTGSIDIVNNKAGCNDILEVAENCGIEVECLPFGNFHLTSQFQIDNFQVDFPNCSEISGNLNISGTDIIDLDGLHAITSISGDLFIHGTHVTNLNGLQNLGFVGGYFFISDNSLLTNLSGLNSLSFIEKSARIENNNALPNLIGLESLTDVGLDLYIRNNSSLQTLEGLNQLRTVSCEGVIIGGNESLTSLSALQNLVSTPGLSISGNPLLQSLHGLDNIVPGSIGWMSIRNNPMLSECDVRSICDFLIYSNPDAGIEDNASGCNSPAEVIVECEDGGFIFVNQFQIDTFKNIYPELTSIEGRVTIQGEDITNLNGLNNITSIGGALNISNNSQLLNLDGLDSLSAIGGKLTILENEQLMDITGIAGIEATTIDTLKILGNIALHNCDVQSICDCLSAQEVHTEIGNNNSFCNHTSEILEMCYEGFEDGNNGNDLVLYPNPTQNEFTLKIANSEDIIRIDIYDVTGKRIVSERNVKLPFDVSCLSPGLFVVQIMLLDKYISQRLIIK